jgi:hypothetical protein
MISSKRRLIAATATLALGLGTAGMAHAGPIVQNALVGGAPTGVSYVNFDDLPLGDAGGTSGGVTVSFQPDAKAVQGSSSGIYAAPYLSNDNGVPFGDASNGADTTTYLTSGSTGNFANAAITLTLPEPALYMGLLWGSVDLYNTLTFYDASDVMIGTITGADVDAAANGDQGVNGTFYVNIISDLAFTKVVATSSQYAFEFDNVAFNATVPVPEPATLALLGAGLFGIAAARRRR